MSTIDSAAPTPRPRQTRQKQAINDALATTTDFVTASELHDKLREAGEKVSLATIYRALQSQADEGILDVVDQADGEALFRLCTTSRHHHHLVCRNCRAAVEVEAPQIERWAEATARQHGFTELTHTVEFFGLCPQCSRAA